MVLQVRFIQVEKVEEIETLGLEKNLRQILCSHQLHKAKKKIFLCFAG